MTEEQFRALYAWFELVARRLHPEWFEDRTA
jgi:hypothetical protein